MRARKPGNSGRLVIRFLVCAAIGAATALVWREIDSDRESARRGVTGRDSSTTLDRSRVDRPPPPRPSPSAGSSRTVRAVLDAFAAARVSGAEGSDSARHRPLRRADVARASRRREHVQPGRRHSEGASIREALCTRLIGIRLEVLFRVRLRSTRGTVSLAEPERVGLLQGQLTVSESACLLDVVKQV